MFPIFHFLQCGMVFGNCKSPFGDLQFPILLNAISNEKSCLISTPFPLTFIDVMTVTFFPPAES